MKIANIDTGTVWAQISEADIVCVKFGQDVYFTILGSQHRWTGRVSQILPTPELINNVAFYDVLFDIPNKERIIEIQMTTQVFIILAQEKNVLLIPNSVIGNANEGAEINVKVLKLDGKVEIRNIKIGIKSEISAEITEGLKEKKTVIIREIAIKSDTKSSLSAANKPK